MFCVLLCFWLSCLVYLIFFFFFFFQAEDGIRDFCLSRGLGDVYKRQPHSPGPEGGTNPCPYTGRCLLYTSDAADERSSVDLGGRRIIKKKKKKFYFLFFFFFSSRRRHTRFLPVSWARRCV